jgi:hypothetical protein
MFDRNSLLPFMPEVLLAGHTPHKDVEPAKRMGVLRRHGAFGFGWFLGVSPGTIMEKLLDVGITRDKRTKMIQEGKPGEVDMELCDDQLALTH